MNTQLGKLVKKYDTIQITDKFKKREFVIELSYKGYVVGNCLFIIS